MRPATKSWQSFFTTGPLRRKAGAAMMRLGTERLLLEPVNERNALTLWRVMQNAHLREFQDVPRLSREEFLRRVASRPRRLGARTAGRFEWLVVVRGEHPVGWVSLRIAEDAAGNAEIGYSIVAEARGRGYATEAARALIDAAFHADLTQIDACCVPANVPSRRLLEAIGFTQVRLHKGGAVVRGKRVDVCVYRLTREDWRDARASRVQPAITARRRTGS